MKLARLDLDFFTGKYQNCQVLNIWGTRNHPFLASLRPNLMITYQQEGLPDKMKKIDSIWHGLLAYTKIFSQENT